MSERRPIGPVDNMWLNMDRPNNLMIIDGVMWFDEPIEFERLGPVLQRRLIDRYPVFSQHPVAPAVPFGTAHWEDDPDFDLSRHLRKVTLPAPGNQDALQRYVENRMSVPFDHAHPMWEMTLIEGYGGGCAVLSRFHHSLADGMALSQVILSLTNGSATADLGQIEEQEWSQPHAGGLLAAARSLLDTGAQTGQGGRHALSLLPALVNPSLAKDVLELGWKTGKVADKLILGHNPQTPFKGEPGVEKRAVWSGPRTIKDVKRVSRLTGSTVNDVLVAAVSGAINTYLRDLGADPVDVTTMVPVNVRPPDEPLPRELGNKFALVYLKLPTGVTQPLQRVAESKQRMDSIKGSPEAFLTFTLNKAIGLLEPHLSNSITNFFSDKAIGVTTNVIGPQTQRYLAGVPIAGAVSWVPGSGQQTLGVCIFSLAGIVRVGFKVDAATLPNPEKLVHAFDQDMDELLRIAAKAG
ncbi:MAG TPA: wax ester/triacylglycerol synthase family O-acyltransferase [Dermatophilaceae bacterium]|nr:wax ester/triacylglycerol synthase family O-acyltransferase [Dermatophilaceae bacterium]